MKLDFEITLDGGIGSYPDLIHFSNTQAQIFYLDGGELYGTPSNKIDNGEWENMNLQDSAEVSPDTGMSLLEMKVLSGFGIVGNYKTGNTHKLIIYEFAFEMDRYLNEGSIRHSINNPISSFKLTLENPDIENPERPGEIVINEKNTLVAPGSKIVFKFGAGDLLEPDFDMGVFYTDRGSFTTLSETARVDGRNKIGKVLKDQTLDERPGFGYYYVSYHISDLFKRANLTDDDYLVEDADERRWFQFKPSTTCLAALEDMLKVMVGWQVKELADGTIVVGSPDFWAFDRPDIYKFYRNKDIFSRGITRDDAESYRRICVHDKNFDTTVYREVTSYEGWNLQSNRTLYVKAVDGTSKADMETYADELANRMEKVGKVESFTGPIRPHIQCGDQAIIIDEDGEENLGLITEITHIFGKMGFSTTFTVDSGGVLGKGRLSDFIGEITKEREGGSIGYTDPGL
ncbi:MAG TPA: hypothetical protein VFC73_08805 [Syntrophomonadaceae bacterium]|nr:hypothetical protein [Syntrophomonadaceae bacterium]